MQELGLVVVVMILGVILSVYGWQDARPGHPNTFLNFSNLVDGIATPMSYYAIMAVGQTLVIITGGIDISVGSVMALSALGSAAVLLRAPEHSSATFLVVLAITIPLLIGLTCGLLNGLMIVGLRLHPFIVTLGSLAIFRCLANVLPWFQIKTLVVPQKTTAFMRYQVGGLEIMPLIIMLIFVVLGFVYLSLMVMGRENYAIGGNEQASRFSGLAVNWIKLRVYALSGLCAGAAGMVSLGHFGTASSNTAMGYELTVIAAAVIGGASLVGGRGSAMGALLGTLVINLINNAIDILHVNQEYKLGITGASIILAVALDQVSAIIRQRRLERLAGAR